MNEKPIYVTRPHLPPLEEFIPYLEQIWANQILTNGGPFHQQLEAALCEHLGVKHISLFTNATIGLVTALQALRITGEVITTPYSFVATAHSLLWNGIKPVFVDIDPVTLNLDPVKIEAAITPQTTAIMPVHCYGTPCNVREIQRIADNYNLKVIYDAAHAFGVEDDDGSVLNHGDLSVLSFHATKAFNTFEGGAIVDLGGLVDRDYLPFLWGARVDEYLLEEGVTHVVLPEFYESESTSGVAAFALVARHWRDRPDYNARRLGLLPSRRVELTKVDEAVFPFDRWIAMATLTAAHLPRQVVYRVSPTARSPR